MVSILPGPKPTKYSFGFLDESGHLKTPQTDRIFALGLLKLQHPAHIHKEIVNCRRKNGFVGEYKFTNVRNHNLNQYKELVDIYFSTPHTFFSTMIFEKNKIDIKAYHHNDAFKAYNAFMAKLIAESLDASEYMVAIADDITTPKDDSFEHDVKTKVKVRLRRNALFGIARAESHAFSELQMVDVLLGAVAYAFKIKHGLVRPSNKNPKLKLVKHTQKLLNVPVLSDSLERNMRSNRTFIIKEFGKVQKRR